MINFHIGPDHDKLQRVSVSGKSSIFESNELREVSKNKKQKHEQSMYENVTIIKRVTERTLTAENVFVSIQVKHNLALRAEYATRISLTLKDSQTTES